MELFAEVRVPFQSGFEARHARVEFVHRRNEPAEVPSDDTNASIERGQKQSFTADRDVHLVGKRRVRFRDWRRLWRRPRGRGFHLNHGRQFSQGNGAKPVADPDS